MEPNATVGALKAMVNQMKDMKRHGQHLTVKEEVLKLRRPQFSLRLATRKTSKQQSCLRTVGVASVLVTVSKAFFNERDYMLVLKVFIFNE